MCAEMINFLPFTDELMGSDSLKVATNEAAADALTRDTFAYIHIKLPDLVMSYA